MRTKSLFYPLFFISILLSSCEFHCSVGDSSVGQEDEKTKPVEKDGAALYNGIQLEMHGVKVSKAYLVTKDEGKRVEDGNFVDVKKGVKLILLIDSGWKEENGRVLLGASLKGFADSGEKVLDQDNLFDSFGTEGITIEDAKIIGLSVSFNKFEATRPVTFNIQFKVWDKKSDAVVEGTYTIHSK